MLRNKAGLVEPKLGRTLSYKIPNSAYILPGCDISATSSICLNISQGQNGRPPCAGLTQGVAPPNPWKGLNFVNGRRRMRILIVEDHPDLARELAEQFARSGFAADQVATLSDAREIVSTQRYDLALLDRRLPDGDGLSLVQVIRRMQPSARILMLSALDAADEKIGGLDAGADDYLTKPFNPMELMARIRANLRRLEGDIGPIIELGNLTFAPGRREFQVDGVHVVLQKREVDLLESLIRSAGRMVIRDRLLEDLYGDADDIHYNSLNVLVSQLRRRLRECDAKVEIHTTRGIGYFLTKLTS
jgi:two-component system OmpR family response regulator